MTCKLHEVLKIGARSIVGCYRLTHRLHDCLCIHLPPIAETVLPKPAILTDYNDIHTQTSLISIKYHCSKSWAVKSDWSVGNYEQQCLLDPLLAVHQHIIKQGRVSGQTTLLLAVRRRLRCATRTSSGEGGSVARLPSQLHKQLHNGVGRQTKFQETKAICT